MASVSKSSSLSLQKSRNNQVFDSCCFDLIIVFTALMTYYCKEIFSSILMHSATKCVRAQHNASQVSLGSRSSVGQGILYIYQLCKARNLWHMIIYFECQYRAYKNSLTVLKTYFPFYVCLHQMCQENSLSY